MGDAAKWVERPFAILIPQPHTPRQLFAERLSRSAKSVRGTDPDAPVPYRAHRGTRVERNGPWAWKRINSDGPAVSEERLQQVPRPRREQMRVIGVQVAADM